MNLRSRARKLFGRELSENTVRASKVEYAVLKDLRKRATAIDDTLTNLPRLPDGEVLDGKVWERLGEDIWSEFYGLDEPSLKGREKIDPRYRVNREIAGKQARDEKFAEAHSMTRGNITESALGWLGAMNSLSLSYGEELAEHADCQNAIADAEDKLDSLDDYLEHLRQLRNDGDPGGLTTEQIDERIRAAAVDKRHQVQRLKDAQAVQAGNAGDLLDAAKVAIAKAQESASEAIEAASLLPGRGAGPGQRVSPDLMVKLAERVNSNDALKKVLEMLGRMELSMGTVRRQFRIGGFEEMVDIEMGNELSVVLPHEKMLLMHPVGKLDFFRRYSERSLMQYEMWSEQELKRGPIIWGADGSDSMRGAPNEFCRGLTLAGCSIGNREGRNTAALEFGSAGQLREFWFPGDRPLDTEVALDFAEHFFAGGTDINQVLVRAKELIDNEAPFHSADLVIVTDGGDRLTPQTIEVRDALRALGVKIHGLCVGVSPTPYLIEVCDKVSSVLDFAGPNPVSDRLAIDLT